MQWVSEHRGDILAAVFVLARSWMQAGRPPGPNMIVGGYENGSHTIGGILHHCGIKDFLGNAYDLYSKSNESDLEWEAFLLGIRGLFNNTPFTAAELAKRAESVGLDLGETGPSIVPPSDLPSLTDSRALGNAFARRADTRYAESGVHVRKAGEHQRAVRWQIAVDNEPEVSPGHCRLTQVGTQNEQVPTAV